jgi:outer membrane protein TolC
MVYRTLLAGILFTAGAFAQLNYFPQPNYFREVYRTPDTKVVLEPPTKLSDFVKTGKDCERDVVAEGAERSAAAAPKLKLENLDVSLEDAPIVVTASTTKADRCLVLSLNDYLSLVMANHTTVKTSYLSLETAKNSLIIAQARLFDPTISLTFKPGYVNSYSTLDSFRYGTRTLDFGSVDLKQTLGTGQVVSVSGNAAKDVALGDVTANSGLNFSITQHLLKGRGSYVTRIPIMQAQSKLKTSRFSLTSSLIDLVNRSEGSYWDLLSAKQSLYVARKNLGIQTQYMDYVNRQLELGAISDLEVFSPQQTVESAKVSVTNQEYAVRNAEDALRRQIGADLDPSLKDIAIVVVDLPDLSPAESVIPDREQMVNLAMTQSPGMLTRLENLDALEYSIAQSKNALLPSLDVTFNTRVAGLNSRQGLAGYMGEMFGWTNSKYSWSVNFTFPVRDRVSSYNLANSLIDKKSSTLALRGAQQDLRLSVNQAVTSFENALRSLDLQKKAREVSQLNYQAQLARYKLGSSTQIEVVKGSQDLATADQAVVNSQISLRKALLSMWVTTGELLDKRNIIVHD